MKKKTRIDKDIILTFLSFVLALTSLHGIGTLAKDAREKRTNEMYIEEEYNGEVAEIEQEIYKYQFHLESDTTNVEEAVNSLGIVKDEALPYNMFKVFRYIDHDGYEKITIVKTYVNFVTDENKNITGYYYTMFDAFNGRLLYTTAVNKNSFMHLEVPGEGDAYYIMDYDELSELKQIAISKGMDEGYVNSVMPDNLERQTLSTYQVASYYVQLVNTSNRLSNTQTIHLG